MPGLILLVTFLATAAVSVVVAVVVGVAIDNLPRVHDLLSVMGFFGTLVVLLPVAWVMAVRFTEPKHPTAA
ncbi:hypothetical protein [Pseudorhodoplanes sp.]|uniref:hypothetical protein n=1 Tax=Pseudorhodoplanes sp. TaxID=1934341 RepID=UPI002C02F9C8|nr:hypothetical protein [Pseudorhodoplanes sp.]HWV52721.1 hypothetical protein [Pseudorhodoplanes sp.]